MTSTKLPYLHKNARSRRITTKEVREVFAEETTRNLPRGINREEYLRKVMP
ncbi:hypothetical protein SEA_IWOKEUPLIKEDIS_58 [Mycobacterium phage Iwokeuplikedis]|nr:hypothetical protein SEA_IWOKEUPLIKEDIS_58 [Mycobacterium phage Iwokeuplikedis]